MAKAMESANNEQDLVEFPAYECSEGTVTRRRTNILAASMPASVQGDNVNMGANQTVVGGDNVGGSQTKIETQLVINVGDGSEKQDFEIDLGAVRQQLMQGYKDTRGTLPLLPGMPEECATMEDLFVDLKIVKEDKKPFGILSKELRSSGELVCIERQQFGTNESEVEKINKVEKVNRVLVKGKPGIGKSSTVSKLAYDWACNIQDSPISEYQLLFAITINEIDNDTDLIGIIQDQLLPEVSGEALRAYIQSNASSICLLLDGYDEATDHFLQCRDVNNVLCSRWLAEACVIVTTRVNEVGKFCQNYGPYVQVEITGFSEKSREQYVDQFFTAYEKDDDAKDDADDDDDGDDNKDSGGDVGGRRRRRHHYHSCRNFLESLRRSTQLYLLSMIPIILSMLCLLWTEDAALPSSVTALYKEVILHLANHAAAKRRHDSLDRLHIDDWVDKILFHVGKVAIQGLFEDKLIFKATDFQCTLLEEAFLIGVMTKERKRSRLRVTYSVTFLHKTFQEFCAAVYWVQLVDTDRKKFDQHLQQITEKNVFEMEYLLRFACGLSVTATKILLPHVVQIMCQHNHLKDNNGKPRDMYENVCQQIPLFLLHEAESNNENVKESYILHSLLKPLYSTIVSQSKSYHKNNEFFPLLLSYLAPLKPDLGISTRVYMPWLADVEHVYLCSSPTEVKALLEGFAQIANMIDKDNINELKNSQQYIQLNRDNETQEIGILQGGLSIEYLDLRGTDIGESVENLAQAYKYMPRLRQLILRCTDLEPPQCVALFDGFIAAGKNLSQQGELSYGAEVCGSGASKGGLSIEHLDLSLNDISESVEKLAQAYKYMPNLKRLACRDTHLNPSNCAALFDAFIVAGKMLSEQDEVSCDAQGNEANALKGGLSIEYLDLSHNNIDESVEKLVQAYKYMPRLRHLGLSCTDLKPSHCAALFDGFFAAGKMLSEQDEVSSDSQVCGSGTSEVGLSIEYLYLKGNTIGESVDKLLQALQYMPHLTFIDVFHCGLDESSLQRLCELRPKCKVRSSFIYYGKI